MPPRKVIDRSKYHDKKEEPKLVIPDDRLARDLLIQESIIADLKRNGFEVISVAEPDLCSDDPSRVLMRQVLGRLLSTKRR